MARGTPRGATPRAGVADAPAVPGTTVTTVPGTTVPGTTVPATVPVPAPASTQPASAPTAAPESPPSTDDIRRALATLRRVVETTCDNVGPRFAEEARRIHYGEAPARGIFGRASDGEADALREEGIEFASVPWPRRGDA